MMREFRIQAIMTLSDFISGPINAIRQGFRATGTDADSLGGKIATLGKRLAPFAIAAGLIVGGMTATALATAETGEALGELATLGAKDLEMFRAKAMQVSNEWAGVTTPAFIRAAYDTKSALSNLSEQAQADITEMAAITSIATKASVEDMTAFIGKAYNIMGKSASFEGLTDVQIAEQLFAGMSSAVKEFMTTGPAMKQSLMSMGNSATIAGIGISDQLAALGQLNNVMEASVAGTGFKTFSNKLPEVAKELGLNFRNASGEMLPLPDILDMITNKVGGLGTDASQMKIMSLFGAEAATAFQSLAEKSDVLRQKTATVGAAMKTGREYVVAMAKAANDNLGANVKKMNQQISNAVEVIGFLFVPILSVAIQFISWLALGIQSVAGVIGKNPLLKWVVQITAILALAFSMMGIFGALTAFLPGIIALVGGYAASMWTAATATLAATWPIYALIAVIGLLVLAYKTNFLGIGDTLRKWYGTVKLVFDGVRAVFASLKGRNFTITGDLADKLKAGGLVGIVTVIAGTLYRLWQVMRGVGDVAIAVGQIIGPIFGAAWLFLWSAISGVISIFQELWSVVRMIVSPIIRLIGLIDPNVWRVFGMVIGMVAAVLSVVGIAIVVYLIAPFLPLIGLIIGATAVVWSFIKILQLLAMVFGFAIKSAFGGFVMLGTLILDGIIKTVNMVIDFLGSIDLADVGRKIWSTLIAGLKSMGSATVDAVKSVFGKIGNLFPHSDAKEGPLSTLTRSGASLLDAFGQGIKSAAPALRASVGIALTGLMPMTAGANIGAEGISLDPVVVSVPAPVIRQDQVDISPAARVSVPAPVIEQQPIEILPARKISAEAAPVEVGAPEVTSAEPVIPAAQPIQVNAPEIMPAAPVEVVAPEVGIMGSMGSMKMPMPEVIPPAPVEMAAPMVTQAEPVIPAAVAPVEVGAPEVMQAAPVMPAPPMVEVSAAEVMVDAPVIDQAPPVVNAAPGMTAPVPEVMPAAPLAMPAARIEMTAPDLVAPGPVTVNAPEISVAKIAPVEMSAPEVMQAAPVIPAQPMIEVSAAEVTVAGPVIDQTAPVINAAPGVTVPGPEIVPAAPLAMPAAQIEMIAPDLVTPAPVTVTAPAVSVVEAGPVEMPAPEIIRAMNPVEMAAPVGAKDFSPLQETPAFESTPLPEPVSRETVRERTVETVRREQAPASAGETRRYTISIQNLTLPGVTDARTFVEQMSEFVDGHDGGNG